MPPPSDNGLLPERQAFHSVLHSSRLERGAPAHIKTYRTQNKKIAAVNGKGYLNAKKVGTADITVRCQEMKFPHSYFI